MSRRIRSYLEACDRANRAHCLVDQACALLSRRWHQAQEADAAAIRWGAREAQRTAAAAAAEERGRAAAKATLSKAAAAAAKARKGGRHG